MAGNGLTRGRQLPVRHPPRVDPQVLPPALIVVAAIRSPNPMVDAMAKRAKTDPKARQMFEGLQVVAGWAQSTSAAVATLMLVLHQKGLGHYG